MPEDRRAAPIEETVTIVGVGLMGGSLGGALRQRGLARRVIGVGRDEGRLAAATAAGLLDEHTTSLADAARRSSLIVFCTPVNRIADAVREAGAVCSDGTVLTDVGSTKAELCADLASRPPKHGTFLGSHPLAGSEKHGCEHADPSLYQDRVCVLTPTEDSPAPAVHRLERFWSSLGMTVETMTPAGHDEGVSWASHLPHVVASAMAGVLPPEYLSLTAGGFRDTTRIASGDPDLWVTILESNRAAVLRGIATMQRQLGSFAAALETGDRDALRASLRQGKEVRDRFAALKKSLLAADD